MQPEPNVDPAVRDLLYQIKFGTNAIRNEAIRSSPRIGSKAIPHLARLLDKWATPGQMRGSQEAIQRIAMNGYRLRGEDSLITDELLKLTGAVLSISTRRLAVNWLAYSTSSQAAAGLTPLLQDPGLRDDARMALERNPSRSAEAALKASASGASGEWKNALTYSLRRKRTSFKNVGTRR